MSNCAVEMDARQRLLAQLERLQAEAVEPLINGGRESEER